jgi:hypothetical protein
VSLEQGIFDHLTADGAVVAVFGSEMYYDVARQAGPTPYVTWHRIDTVRAGTRHLGGPSPLVRTRIQFDVYGDTRLQTLDGSRVLRKSLDGFSGTMGGAAVGSVAVEDDSDFFDPTTDLKRRKFDAIIWHCEE